MSEHLELPTEDVRAWIANASRTCGHQTEVGELLGYCAWWLENRGVAGVTRACTYLLLVHEKPASDLDPRIDSGAPICLCPMTAGLLVSEQVSERPDKFAQDWVECFATADAVMMAAILTNALKYKFNVHLRFYDQHLVFSEKAVHFLSKSLATFGLIDSDAGVPTSIRLTPPEVVKEAIVTFEYVKQDVLSVPARRYNSDGSFRFD